MISGLGSTLSHLDIDAPHTQELNEHQILPGTLAFHLYTHTLRLSITEETGIDLHLFPNLRILTFWLLPAADQRINLYDFLAVTLRTWSSCSERRVLRFRPRDPSAFTRAEYVDVLADVGRITEHVLCAPDSICECVRTMFGEVGSTRVVVMIPDKVKWRRWWAVHAIARFPNLHNMHRLKVKFEQRESSFVLSS